MKIKAAEAFCKLVELGGIGPAADAMYCVPSNITKMIKELEKDLSEPLFNKHRGRLILSPFGRQYYLDVLQLIALNKRIEEKFRQKKGRYSLTIGAIDVAADYWLPERISIFMKNHPEINIRLFKGHSHEMEDGLYEHKFDIIFSDGPIITSEINSIPVFDEKLVLVGDPQNVLIEPIPLYSFSERCFYRKVAENWLVEQPVGKYQIMDMESYQMMATLIEHKLGVAFIPLQILKGNSIQSSEDSNISINCKVYAAWSRFNPHQMIDTLINEICLT